MLTWIFTHQWKEATRAAGWQNSLLINIIMGIMMLILVLNLVVVGFFLNKILAAVVPGQDVVLTFNKFVIYYLGLDLVLRFMLQQLQVLAVQPYLHLPVRKSRLIHFLLVKSVWSFWNLLPLLLALPFAFRAVWPAYGQLPVLGWLTGLLCLVLANNFLIVYLKRQLTLKPGISLLLAAGLVGLGVLEYFGLLPLSAVSGQVFGLLLAHPAGVLVLLLLPAGLYVLNYTLLRRNMYSREPENAAAGVASVPEFAILQKFGAAGNLLALEMKLIWRNKRPRSTFLMSFFMLFYGVNFFIRKDNGTDTLMIIMAAMFITGSCMVQYGTFLHSWDANYFDSLMTRNISTYQYYRSKFLLFVGMCSILLLFSLPYGWFGWYYLALIFALYLYNIGVNSFVIFFLAIYGPKKINLAKNAAFNWEGTGGAQVLMGIPLILGPVLIYLPFYMFHHSDWGLMVLGAMGLAGLVFHKLLLRKLAERLNGRKYKMAAEFRAA